MDKNVCLSFLLFISISVIGAKVFRFDYTYHENIKGWLKLHRIPATWQEARERCSFEGYTFVPFGVETLVPWGPEAVALYRELAAKMIDVTHDPEAGAVLASPANKDLQSSMIIEFNNSSSISGIHTGIHSMFAKGVFQSVEGVPLDRMSLKWSEGEPDDAGKNENCIAYTPNGTIGDENCSEALPYMCYKKQTEDMVITKCGTTDKDYMFEELTGSCYKFHNDKRTWSKAIEICAAEGAYLSIINSEDEANFLRFLGSISEHPIDVIYVGFYDWNKQGDWRTIHGQTLQEAGFDGWASKQPDNSTPGEFCGSIHTDAKLNDRWCDSLLPFVCEKSPDSLL